MTIYLPGSGHKPELFNSKSGSGSIQKNSSFWITSFKLDNWMKIDLMLAIFGSLELQKQKTIGQIHGISTKFAYFNNNIYNYMDIMC